LSWENNPESGGRGVAVHIGGNLTAKGRQVKWRHAMTGAMQPGSRTFARPRATELRRSAAWSNRHGPLE
jgi:hypothetical protein